MASLIDKLAMKVYEYQQMNVPINTKRAAWQGHKKELIKNVFADVLRHMQTEFEVKINEEKRNYESVTLKLTEVDSGISEMVNGESVSYKIAGGALIFSLLQDGYVSVDVTFPYIEKLAPRPEPKNLVKNIDPTTLSGEIILDFVDNFMSEVLEYKGSKNHNIPLFKQQLLQVKQTN